MKTLTRAAVAVVAATSFAIAGSAAVFAAPISAGPSQPVHVHHAAGWTAGATIQLHRRA